MQVNPYLSFNGNCAEAMRFYEQLFGGKAELKRWGESPMAEECGPANKDKVMHACLQADGFTLMGSDTPDMPDNPDCRYVKPQGITVTVNVEKADEAERIFAALAEGGNVQMPIAETFWAERFGMCTDRFGIPWMVNCLKAQG